ncbi:MAG: isoprenyl transferase [Verrucomicrobiota bacterium]
MSDLPKQEPPQLDKTPRHVAIIMDGNGRWAQEQNLPRLKGHEKGANAVKEVLQAAADSHVEYLTLYAFSVENWNRPKAEVDGLMTLLSEALKKYRKDLVQNGIRLHAIGRLQDLPQDVNQELNKTIEASKTNTKLNLVLALSYGGRLEIVDAARSIVSSVQQGSLDPNSIDEKTIREHLYASEMPDPDLLIRSSGEQRLSNFLLWQVSYSEIYISPVLWPDFSRRDFFDALVEYNNRHRRFGGV